MSRCVYLHIGAPKTGTTYLQGRLGVNVKSLAAHGVHVPSSNVTTSPALSQFRAALDLLGQDWGGTPGHAVGSWDALAKRVRRLSGSVIISHEILAPASPEHVARALASLKGSEVHVVYSARDLGRQVPAAWQESIKQGRSWTYRRFAKQIIRRKPWFAQAFDLPRVLETWGKDLPPERIHLVTVPHSRGPELWLRFCTALGVDPAWAPRDSTASNASLGVAETAMLRRLNLRMDRKVSAEGEFDELVRRMLAADRLVRRRSAPLLLPPHLQGWAEDQAQGWIDYATASGIDVIGDLGDLRPATPAPDAKWTNPDKVRAKAQLRAAIDALVAMSEEAARRDDPDDRLVAKVRTRIRDRRGN